ncbi:MAG: ZIP family metal transporter [Candidatus Competibacterales bacterium]
METSALAVFLAALVTALATGLGALPFLFRGPIHKSWLAVANGLAAGLMISASLMLCYEGAQVGFWRMVLGVLAGIAFIAACRPFLERHEDELTLGELKGADAKKALMIIGVMTLHSASEGIGVGVPYGSSQELGIFITIAIAVHNIPEGLAISLIMVPRGASVWAAAGWSIFSSLPQPLLAVPAFYFVEYFEPFLPVGLGFAGGAMTWMACRELLPEALEDGTPVQVGSGLVVGLLGMTAFQYVIK